MIAQIELAMLAALKAAGDFGVLGYAWRTLETYPEEWDSYLKEKGDWKSPAAWAVFAGANAIRFTDLGNVRLEGAQFGLVVAAENLRNETATRHGGPAGAGEPGSYQLALDALAILSGRDLGLDIDQLVPRSLRLVRPFDALKERKVSMIALQFETAFEITTLPPEADLDAFKTLHLDWDVPAFGAGRAGPIDGDPDEPGVQLPAPAIGPGSADASDHLTLPQE
ncbi:phage protein Gp37 [Sphingopyxis granuli]|uniref:phage protein Gp37 n=1 Tax=Sphingopyxis granuli TaxID=267128 RepID=UPI001BAE87A2|nr:phage protein Gp37 [Sphingopyxis granuli]QUM72183.1 DUF1834 family protein [Sphingopyxis granuli]